VELDLEPEAKNELYCSLSTVYGRRRARESLMAHWGLGTRSDTMLMQIRFGAHHGPTCPACTRMMYVTRRTPHPLYGNTYELQTFKCRTCGDEIERSADQSGLPHVADAAVLTQHPLG
jgi:hypothetical protein